MTLVGILSDADDAVVTFCTVDASECVCDGEQKPNPNPPLCSPVGSLMNYLMTH